MCKIEERGNHVISNIVLKSPCSSLPKSLSRTVILCNQISHKQLIWKKKEMRSGYWNRSRVWWLEKKGGGGKKKKKGRVTIRKGGKTENWEMRRRRRRRRRRNVDEEADGSRGKTWRLTKSPVKFSRQPSNIFIYRQNWHLHFTPKPSSNSHS